MKDIEQLLGILYFCDLYLKFLRDDESSVHIWKGKFNLPELLRLKKFEILGVFSYVLVNTDHAAAHMLQRH